MSESARLIRIRQRLEQALCPIYLNIIDESPQHIGHAGARSGGGHYNVTIVSTQFSGWPLLKRHRLIYQALGDLMGTEIHALSLKTFTPEEWKANESNR